MTQRPSGSRRHAALEWILRRIMRPQLRHLPLHGGSLAYLRGLVEATGRLLDSPVLGGVRGTLRVPVDTYGPTGETVKGEWAIAAEANTVPGDGTILYFHGGGYVMASPRAVRPATSALSHHSGLPVFAAGYRRAPEAPHPAAWEDALATYAWLLRQGVPADRVVLAGDSAGAHLALALALELAAQARPRPAALVLFSPVLDPLGDATAEPGTSATSDPLLPAEFARRAADAVLGDAQDGDPRVRLLETDLEVFAGLPPVHVSVGATEHFREDSVRLHRLLDTAGVPHELHVRPRGIHSDVMFGHLVPETRDTLVAAADFIHGLASPAVPAP